MITIRPLGEAALQVVFGEQIDLRLNRRVHTLVRRLDEQAPAGVRESVPGYTTLTVHFDPLAIDSTGLQALLRELAEESDLESASEPRVVEIPVHYGGAEGPDLPFVAERAGLHPQEVVSRHTGRLYPVYFLGFMPGFPYLGGMDPRIAAPRLETPRARVPAGSVGIAGEQTGIYPLQSPGGWRIIGRTPVRLFDPQREPPFLLVAGDIVRFIPIEDE